jgi:hypothetical protein
MSFTEGGWCRFKVNDEYVTADACDLEEALEGADIARNKKGESMETIVSRYLESLELGELQQFKNMAVFPIFTSVNHGPEYLTLKEALEKKFLTVTEMSHGGSVPELMAINKGDLPVLLLDGEELSGAKQNRVLNTTILLKEHSETVIPVSCTEHGRWSYTSAQFSDSDVIMSRNIRQRKAQTVTDSLRTDSQFRANQSQVWEDIHEMASEADVHSPTGSMRDVYQSREDMLDEYLNAFTLVPHQNGILVFTNGKAAGFDVVSLESACAALHPKLVKSYAMDAYLEVKKAPKEYQISPDKAHSFLKEAAVSQEQKYQSIGHGWDYRYEGQSIVGSALVFDETVIHTAFFRAAESDKIGHMSGSRQRRGHRF